MAIAADTLTHGITACIIPTGDSFGLLFLYSIGAFGCCAPAGEGLFDGLEWLVSALAQSKVQKSVAEPVAQTVAEAKSVSGKLLSPATHWLKQLTSWWSGSNSVPDVP